MTYLTTNNLTLRAVTENDVDEVTRMWDLGVEPVPPEKARDVIKRLTENHNKNSPGHIYHLCLAVFKDARIIGWCGLDGTRDGIVNIFYLIAEEQRNNGYATECGYLIMASMCLKLPLFTADA